LWSRGYEFKDHQFQYVDPAYHLGLGGSWWRPHDYVQGLRSWVYPGFLAGIFRVLSGLGIHDAGTMMAATRLVHAFLGLIPLASLWMLLVRWKGFSRPRAVLLFAAMNPIMVYSSVQPTGPTFAVGLGLTAVFLFEGPGRLWPLVSGVVLGLAFCCRFQDAFLGPALLAAGLIERRWLASAIFAAGAAIMVTFQGFVDLATWGSFFHSPLRYVAWNVFEGAAARYGQQHFWYYLPFILLVLVLIPPFLKSGFEAIATGSRRFPLFVGASALYLLLHSLVARKALRFVLLPLVLLAIACASELLYRRVKEPILRRLHRRLFIGVHLLALVFLSFWYPHRGSIEAARALARQGDFVDRLVIVDGQEDSLGGHYYLRRGRLDVSLVERQNLSVWLGETKPPVPLYILVVGEPLGPLSLSEPYELDQVGDFLDWPDLQKDARRFLYRLRARVASTKAPHAATEIAQDQRNDRARARPWDRF
jgi:hypothetical protein